MRAVTKAGELPIFFVCAYAFTWMAWIPPILGHRSFVPIGVGTLGPAIAALIAQRICLGDWRAFQFWSSWRRMALGALLSSIPLLLACLAAAAASTESGYRLWDWPSLLRIPRLFLPNLLMGPLEELGWRGFALPRLQARFHPLAASVILGLFWANWHLPLLAISFYTTPYWLYVPLIAAVSVIIGFGFNLCGGSAGAIYLHGLFNVGLGILLNDFLGKATVRPVATQSAMTTLSFLAVALLLALATKGRLGLKPVELRDRTPAA